MDFTDLHKVIGPLATIIGGFVTIIGFFFWWHKRVVNRLEPEAAKLREEVKAAIQAKEAAEALVKAATDQKSGIVRKAMDLKSVYETVKKERDNATAQVEQLVAKLAAAGAEHQRKLNDHDAAWQRFAAAKKEEIERLLGEKATVMAERDAIAERLEEARGKLADERKLIRELLKQQGRIWLAKVPKDVPPFRSLKERKAVIIAVLNLKGGVGKTTIPANLAGYLGETGKRVLLLDLDYQRSLSRMLLPISELASLLRAKRSIQSYFQGDVHDGPQLLSNSTKITGMENCELIPNHDPSDSETDVGLDDLEMQMMIRWQLDRSEERDVRFLLRAGLHSDACAQVYDYVFLDCPPRLTTACINAVATADFVLVPVQPEEVAIKSVLQLLARLRLLKEEGISPSLEILGVLGNMVRPQNDLETSEEAGLLRSIENMSGKQWPGGVSAFRTILTRMTQYFDASRELVGEGELRLAVSFQAVKRFYQQLVLEVESRIYDHRGTL